MKSLLTLFSMLLAMTLHAQDDMTKLKALNARFINNFITNDTASHNKILHKDFTLIDIDGNRTKRKKYLEEWATGYTSSLIYFDFRKQDIKIFGNTALVSSVTKGINLKDGVEKTNHTIYTDIYIKENDEWKCIQAQITPVSKKHIPKEETIVKKYINGKIQ
ncbi:MAG: nuclear transport factor 2 family protein [Cyclobacteriaceae bacterium]|nr:nuclear transport factor 2 family protein [Cyclobacteriaceae bacterium]